MYNERFLSTKMLFTFVLAAWWSHMLFSGSIMIRPPVLTTAGAADELPGASGTQWDPGMKNNS
jgi:hypothetical protein